MDTESGIHTISFETFASVDIRVGKILTVEALEKSDKLLVLTVDLGEPYGTVEILSGIRQWYTSDDLTHKNFLFVANLQPRPMMGKVSHGMIVALDGPEKPELIAVGEHLAPGSRIR